MRQQPHAWAVLALALAACVSLDRPPADKRRYLLEAARPEVRPTAGKGVLVVAPFRVQAPFAGQGFVHRRPAGEVEADFGSEFFVPPGVLLAGITRRWLADAGLFATVSTEGTRLGATHVLEVDVLDLCVDQRSPGTAHAVLEIEFVVLDDHRQLVHHGRLAQRHPIGSVAPEAIVAGWSACVTAALTDLETALRARVN